MPEESYQLAFPFSWCRKYASMPSLLSVLGPQVFESIHKNRVILNIYLQHYLLPPLCIAIQKTVVNWIYRFYFKHKCRSSICNFYKGSTYLPQTVSLHFTNVPPSLMACYLQKTIKGNRLLVLNNKTDKNFLAFYW